MTDFPPSRRGRMLYVILIVVLAVSAASFAWLASREPISLRFMIYILVAIAAFFPLPFLGYWFYALSRANYNLDRDRLILTWGLRVEQIPVSEVEWVRPGTNLAAPLRFPLFRLPGAILGSRRHPDLGLVEFLASETKSLLLVATARHVFAISPADPAGFMQNIQRAIEMGSLTPAVPESVYPSFVVARAWKSPLIRYLWLAGLFLNIGLLAWVSLMVPTLKGVPLGFLASGAPGEPVPAAGLILLPAISIFFYVLGWIAGLFFFRRQDQLTLAQIVWAGGVFSSLLFLVAVMFLVTAPV